MIEFLLIFALGFLAAAIMAMLITPAIYGRIVKLTEKRIEATVPLSHAEIKGKADLMRAGFASETAKLTAQLDSEREQRTESTIRADKLKAELAQVAGEKQIADQHIEELIIQAGDLRSEDRKKQQVVDKLTDTVRQYERIKTHDNTELARLHNDLMTISTEVESMRIDLAANSAEAESLRAQVDSLNMQRDQLLNDIETLADAAQTMEKTLHTEQESHNEARIELAATQSTLVDREQMLEQTFDQIEQQKTQLEEQIVTHQKERDKLMADIDAAAAAGREIQQNLEKEQEQHEATRIELASVQSSLADRETQLVRTRDDMEEQKRQLGVEIESLNLERSRLEREIEVAAQNTLELENSLKQDIEREQQDHEKTRLELAARQSLLEDRMKQIDAANQQIEEHRQQLEEADEANRQTLQELKKTQLHSEMLSNREQNIKAALEKSRTAERASREKLNEIQTEGKQLRNQITAATSLAGSLEERLDEERAQSADTAAALKTKEQELAARGKQLEDALGEVSARETDLQAAKAEQARLNQLRESEKKPLSDLEQQIGVLKTELQQSHATSAQYQEQLKKMRHEINRLHRHEALAQSNGIVPPASPLPETAKRDVNGAVRERMEDLRQRHAALVDKLKNTDDDSADPGMREELAAIAAAVVGLSGQREGKASPIHKIISKTASVEAPGTDRLSLARRAKVELEG